MRLTRLLPLLIAVVPAAGCGDDIKFPDPTELPDPALNGVFPAQGFTDRTLRVEISGDGTDFTGTPTVDFGEGITVGPVELSSPSTLFATITITGNAILGKHDVKVKNGDTELLLTAAFDVQTPLEIITLGPSLQWGRNQILVINHDPSSPFLGNLAASAGAGVTIILDPSVQTESIAFGDVFLDDNAASGSVVINDVLLDTVTSRGGVLEVTPRTPTALTAPGKGPAFQVLGTTLTDTTAVFSYTATAPGIWRTTADGAAGTPSIFLLPDGKWANAIQSGADNVALLANAQTVNIVTFDDFNTGLVYDLSADLFHDTTGAVVLNEVEDNDFFTGTPQAIPSGQDVTVFKGVLNTDDSGFDDITLDLEDGDVVRVTTTTGPNGFADTAVMIFDPTFTLQPGNGFEDDPFCIGFGTCFPGEEDFVDFAANDDINADAFLFASDTTSDPLPAGTYVIEAVSSFFAGDDSYEMAITITHAPL